MPSIHREVLLEISAERAWSALQDVRNAHRVFAGVLVDSKLDGEVRTVKFANGMEARERIVDIDDERRRVVYSAQGAPFEHHNASMQIVPLSDGRSRFVWISDFLPAEIAASIESLIDEGCRAIKRNLQSQQQAQ